VSTVEIAEARAAVEAASPLAPPRWRVLRRLALATYAAAFMVVFLRWGMPLHRELVIAWTCGALACASIGRSPREIVRLAFDWIPFAAILVVYDVSRGVADSVGTPVHTNEMIDADRWLFGGQVPTEWLQQRLVDLERVHWWDVGFALIYSSHFVVPIAVAGVLWARNRDVFVDYAKRFVTLSFAGLATYVAFPAAPPWLAAEQGALSEASRTTARGLEVINVHAAYTLERGQETVNEVAAVPSLHAAFAALVALFLWRRVPAAWRPLLALYAVAMGLTLVATGEHYAVDVFLGWAYAAAVMVAWGWWERRRTSAAIGELG
jgi:membrane-associated phospholipid phosphatase